MGERPDLKTVPDDRLLRDLFEILQRTRQDEAELVAHIAEVDARRLYARQAAPSMFVWCTERLHLSEHEAYLRIKVARASREHPVLLKMLREGQLHLSAIGKLAPHLTPENRASLLKRAKHSSKRQVEELVASLVPRPPAPAVVRRLPAPRGRASLSSGSDASGACAQGSPGSDPRPGGALGGAVGDDAMASGSASARESSDPASGPRTAGGSGSAFPSPAPELGPDRVPPSAAVRPRPAVLTPVAEARFSVRFDASAELRDKLVRLQALMRSSVPDGDLGAIIEQAVTEKLERLEAKRFGKTKKPRKGLARADATPRSRSIPAPVKRHVQARDGGRCAYRDAQGRRCSERHDLEFHHRVPYGMGGQHTPENLILLCRAHNRLRAEQDYGKEVMARHTRGRDRGEHLAAAGGRAEAPRAP